MSYTVYYSKHGFLHASVPLIMGTRFDALLFGSDIETNSLWSNVENELFRIEKMLNRYDNKSELTQINHNAPLFPVELSDELWDIMIDCRKYYIQTNGWFDVSAGNFNKLNYDEAKHTLTIEHQGTNIDLGGYGKGYALKKIHNYLINIGIERSMINFGNSSIATIGTHPYGDSWNIDIEDPFSRGNIITSFQLCNNSSLSVSGNTPANPFHITNTKTNTFVKGDKLVAVETLDPLDAEIVTTAWIASDSEQDTSEWMTNFCLLKTFKKNTNNG